MSLHGFPQFPIFLSSSQCLLFRNSLLKFLPFIYTSLLDKLLDYSLLSICPVCITFSKPSFFINHHKNVNCIFLITSIVIVSIFLKTSHVLPCSTHAFSASSCSTTLLLPQVSSSSVRENFLNEFSSIHYHIGGLILHSSSAYFFLFM